jgi:F1F0 ATPase subunit 2
MIGELLTISLAVAAGLALGGFYFGTLWVVVRRLPDTTRPGLWLALSAVLRTAAVLAAFYAVMGGDWRRLLACLAGFLAVRTLLIRRVRSGVGSDRTVTS